MHISESLIPQFNPGLASREAPSELLIHRIEACMMQLFLTAPEAYLAHNKEGELSHPARTNINNYSHEYDFQ